MPMTISFAHAIRVWSHIGLFSFGGPAGQIALMHKILVQEKRWISEDRFLHALNYCMLLPGPEAQQLATYVGWLLHGTKGGLTAGLLFILPGVLAIMGLSLAYAMAGQSESIAGLFFGLKCAVLAIVVQAMVRMGKKALSDASRTLIALLAFLSIFVFAVPFPLIILGAAVLGGLTAGQRGLADGNGGDKAVLDRLLDDDALPHTIPSLRRAVLVLALWLPLWLLPVAALWLILGPDHVFSRIGWFFSHMAMVTFGGAYAVLAYVAQEAVGQYQWLTQGQMLDGLGLAETTPGPLILVLQFVGFMAAYAQPGCLPAWLAGCLGAVLTVWVTFAPCFLWIFLGGPYIEQIRHSRILSGALSAITAAVAGIVAHLTLWFGLHVIFRQSWVHQSWGGWIRLEIPVPASLDPAALFLSAAALIATLTFKTPMIPTLAACALAGLILGQPLHH